MRLAAIASIIVAAVLLSCYELGIRATTGKEKKAFAVLTVLTAGLSIGLVLYPDTPGRTICSGSCSAGWVS